MKSAIPFKLTFLCLVLSFLSNALETPQTSGKFKITLNTADQSHIFKNNNALNIFGGISSGRYEKFLYYNNVLYFIDDSKLYIIDFDKNTKQEVSFDTILTSITLNPNKELILSSVAGKVYVFNINNKDYYTVELPKPVMYINNNVAISYDFDLYLLDLLKRKIDFSVLGVGRQRNIKAQIYQTDKFIVASLSPDIVGIYDIRNGFLLSDYVFPYNGFIDIKRIQNNLYVISENHLLCLNADNAKKLFMMKLDKYNIIGSRVYKDFQTNQEHLLLYSFHTVYILKNNVLEVLFSLPVNVVEKDPKYLQTSIESDSMIIFINIIEDFLYVYTQSNNTLQAYKMNITNKNIDKLKSEVYYMADNTGKKIVITLDKNVINIEKL